MGRPRLADWHGTATGYKAYGCKCSACLAAHARGVNTYRVRSRLGTRRTTVDAEPVRVHILQLRAEGMSYPAIAREAGTSTAAVRRIAIGDRARVWSRTAALVLAIPLAPAEPELVDQVVVDRLRSNPSSWRRIGATKAERLEAARRLGASSWKDLGINGREFRHERAS